MEVIIWISLTIIFGCLALGFIIAWAILLVKDQGIKACSSPFGMTYGKDGNQLSICGTSGNEPCIYQMTTINAAEQQCNLLESACKAFTYDPVTYTMKIVDPSKVFDSTGTYLFIRQ